MASVLAVLTVVPNPGVPWQLCPSRTTEEDVDEQIRWLKQDLDEVAQAMKKAIRDRAR